MHRNNGNMIIESSTHVSFESSATVEPRQRISNIYIYLYVSDQSVFIGSEIQAKINKQTNKTKLLYKFMKVFNLPVGR